MAFLSGSAYCTQELIHFQFCASVDIANALDMMVFMLVRYSSSSVVLARSAVWEKLSSFLYLYWGFEGSRDNQFTSMAG